MAEQVESRRILTVPNALSAIRILLIPAFIVLLLDPDTRLAGFLLLARDAIVLAAAVWLALTGGPRIEVRPIGKYATFTLMWGLPLIAWGNAGLPFEDFVAVFGWLWFGVGTVEYYAAAVAYARDLRTARRS